MRQNDSVIMNSHTIRIGLKPHYEYIYIKSKLHQTHFEAYLPLPISANKQSLLCLRNNTIPLPYAAPGTHLLPYMAPGTHTGPCIGSGMQMIATFLLEITACICRLSVKFCGIYDRE